MENSLNDEMDDMMDVVNESVESYSKSAKGKKGLAGAKKEGSDSVLDAYETYVLTGGNVEEALQNLVKGSTDYNNLFFLDLLKRKGGRLNEKEEAEFKAFMKNSKDPISNKLQVWYDILQYSSNKTPAEKEAILDDLNKKYISARFNYEAPIHFTKKTEEKAKEAEIACQVKPIDWQAKIIEVGKKNLSALTIHGLRELDPMSFEKLEEFIEYQKKCSQEIVTVNQERYFKRLKNEMAKLEQYLDEKNTHLDEDIPKIGARLSIEQLGKLVVEEPRFLDDNDFFAAYCTKKFYKELKAGQVSKEERMKNLLKIYEYSLTVEQKYPRLKAFILHELLDLGEKCNTFSKNYFFDYLKAPIRKFHFIYKDALKANVKWENVLEHILSPHNAYPNSCNTEEIDKTLIEKYLWKFYKDGAKKEEFIGFLTKKYLNSKWEEFMVLSGENVDIGEKDASRIAKLVKETRLILCPHNKESFAIGEEPSLFVDIKNVSSLSIKLFEINLESYYKKTSRAMMVDVNLEGLTPSFEKVIEYKSPQYLLLREELKFPELKGKTGAFAIDLYGGGRHSRAVLKIGALSYICTPTIYGQECYILDSDKRICAGENTKILIGNEAFDADKKGRILVPYMFEQSSRTAILIHEKLAQVITFTRSKEDL